MQATAKAFTLRTEKSLRVEKRLNGKGKKIETFLPFLLFRRGTS